MAYTDRQLKCVDCGTEFTFSSSQQERFAQLGFVNEPKRCAPCRAAKKERKTADDGPPGTAGSRREMFPAICAECGQEARVPFRPHGDRPVYCTKCFGHRR